MLLCQLILTTNVRLHLVPRPYSSTGLRSRLSRERGLYFPYLRTLTRTSRLRYTTNGLVAIVTESIDDR